MKVKMFVVVTNAERFASGETDYAFSLFQDPPEIEGWHKLHSVEITVPDELIPDVHRQAIADLDAKEKETRETFERAMSVINDRRAKLLALAHNPESE